MSDEPGIDLATRLALRPSEAAQALGVSERKLRALLPQLPTVRTGGVVLLPVKELQHWLTEQSAAEASALDEIVDGLMSELSPAND